MKINNVSLLIPIHPPHFNYIYHLLDTFIKNDIVIDTYLIFSSEHDYQLFTMKSHIKPIIVDEPMNHNCIAVFKKMYGLQKLINEENEYIVCVDSEIQIIPENFKNINNKINDIFTNLKVYAGDTSDNNDIRTINTVSATLFPNDYAKLKELTNNFNLYCFWSDLPVYKKSHLPDFFDYIKYNENKLKLIYHHFEDVIYKYYLVLKHNFYFENITPYTNIYWSLERLETNDINVLNHLYNKGYGFSYITMKSFRMTNYCNNHALIIYHLDRY
jgi:hypothetical protein